MSTRFSAPISPQLGPPTYPTTRIYLSHGLSYKTHGDRERERERHTHTRGKPGRKRKGQSNSTMSSVAVADVLRTSSGAYTTGLLPSFPHSRISRIIRPLSHRAYTADQTLHLTSECAEQAQVCQSLFVYRRHSCRRSCHTEA